MADALYQPRDASFVTPELVESKPVVAPPPTVSTQAPALVPGTQTMSSDLDTLSGAANKQMTDLLPRLMQARQDQAQVTKDTSLAEAKQLGDYRSQLADIYKNNAPKSVDMSGQPRAPEANPIQTFGSMASLLGIFASAFTRRPFENALNAASSAMNAQRQNDLDTYDRSYKEWEDNAKLGLKRHELESQTLNQILELADKDQNAALAQLKAYGAANGSQAASVLAQIGDWAEIGKYAESMSDMRTKLAKSVVDIQMAEENRKLKQAQTGYYQQKTEDLKSGGGLSSAQRVKLTQLDNEVDDALDNVTKAIKLIEDNYAIAGLPGSVRQYGEPLSNLFGSDSTQEAEFKAAIANLKMRLPGLSRGGSGKGLKADESYLNDIIGGVGFKNSSANTVARLENLQQTLMKQKNMAQGLLTGKNANPSTAEDLGVPSEGTSWQDAPVINSEE